MTLKVDQAVRAAREVIVQDATSNVRNIRSRRPYDGAGDDVRSAALDVWQWSTLLGWCERADAPEGVRELAGELRSRLSHPSAVKP